MPAEHEIGAHASRHPVKTGSSFEQGVQGVISSLDQGRGAKVLQAFIWLGVVGFIFSFYAWSQFRGLRDAEAMDYAQVARNLAEGRGFTTRCVRPSDIWSLDANSGKEYALADFPDARHAPLYPAVLAAGFRILKPSFSVETGSLYAPEKRVIVPLGIVFSMATGFLILLMGRRLFNPRVGLLGAIIFFVTDSVLADSISGTPLPLITFLTTAASYSALVAALNKAQGLPFSRWAVPLVVSALLCALVALTGYTMAVLAPALAFFVAGSFDRGRVTTILVFLAVFFLAVLPWAARNKKVSGAVLGTAPYEALNQTVLYEGDSFDRAVNPDLHRVLVVRSLKTKLISNLAGLYDLNLRTLGTGLVVCFFLASFFYRFDGVEMNRFRWCLLLGVFILMIVTALCGGSSVKNLKAFLPLVILYGAAFFLVIAQRWESSEPGWDVVLGSVFVLLAAVPVLLKLVLPPERPYPPYHPPLVSFVSNLLDSDEKLCTDIPWATAWYGKRVSILLPCSVAEFREINDSRIKINGLYLTTETGDRPYTHDLLAGSHRSWLPILNGKVPDGFPLTNALPLPPGSRDQLFLTDRVRWKEIKSQKSSSAVAAGKPAEDREAGGGKMSSSASPGAGQDQTPDKGRSGNQE